LAARGLDQENESAEKGPEGGGEIAEERKHQGGSGGDAEGIQELDVEGFADAEAAGGERDGGQDRDDGEDDEQVAEGECEIEGAGDGGGGGGEQEQVGEGERGRPKQMPGILAEEEQGVVSAVEEGANAAMVLETPEPWDALEEIVGEKQGDESEGGE